MSDLPMTPVETYGYWAVVPASLYDDEPVRKAQERWMQDRHAESAAHDGYVAIPGREPLVTYEPLVWVLDPTADFLDEEGEVVRGGFHISADVTHGPPDAYRMMVEQRMYHHPEAVSGTLNTQRKEPTVGDKQQDQAQIKTQDLGPNRKAGPPVKTQDVKPPEAPQREQDA